MTRSEEKAITLKETLREGVCKVAFMKQTGDEAGSVRIMLGTLKSDYLKKRLPTPKKKANKKLRKTDPNQIMAYDVEKGSFRSFKVDSVLAFEKVDATVYRNLDKENK